MRFRSQLALALLTLCLQVPVLLAQAPDGLSLRAVRTYRPEQGGQTRVRVLIQVPMSIMEPGTQGVSYLVAVKVADEAGITLHTDSWHTRIPGDPRLPGAYGIEMLDFAVAPGSYSVAVDVTDSVSAKTLSSTLPVEAFKGRPEASDLTLASAMRTAGTGDTVPRPGEVRKGNTLFNPAAILRLAPDSGHTEAYYVLEAYNDGTEESGTMAVEVVDEAGKAIFALLDREENATHTR